MDIMVFVHIPACCKEAVKLANEVGTTDLTLRKFKLFMNDINLFQCEAYVSSVLWWYDAWTR